MGALVAIVTVVAGVWLLIDLYRYMSVRDRTEADRLEERRQMRDDRR